MKHKIKVPHSALIKAVARQMVAIPISKLGLARTVPEFCRRQNWPEGELVDGIARGHAFVGAALASYAVGAIHQQVRVPAFLRAHLAWDAMCREHGRGAAQDLLTAAHVVECMSPGRLPVGHADRLDTLLGIEAKREVLA